MWSLKSLCSFASVSFISVAEIFEKKKKKQFLEHMYLILHNKSTDIYPHQGTWRMLPLNKTVTSHLI